ncbi:MAG: acyltransferase family protein, partial [Lachnospiraceae bacterium]|nr:acyltransferase family protein [Lachnospiraceae bacterium]
MNEGRIDKRFRRRDANFELLRILAMFMVIVLHYLAHGGLLPEADEPLSRDTITGSILESFCIAAVNVWVLISGYFLSRTGVSLKRLFKVILEVWFYTIIITSVMILTGNGIAVRGGVYGILEAFLPISSEHYWFATAYVFMFLFSPLLNKGVIVLSRRQLKYTIIGLLFWFSIIKSFVPVALATDDHGYGFGWFLVLYLIAAYMRKYDVRILNSARGGLIVWLLSGAGILLLTVLTHTIHLSTGRLATWLGTPYH